MSARSHFAVAGIPIRVEPLFWVITVIMGLDLQTGWLIGQWVLVVFVSILIHELGHGLALKAFGQRSSIVLHGFGGLTFSQRRLSKRRSIAVSLAGPLAAGLLLGVPAYLAREAEFGRDAWTGGPGIWPIVFFGAYVNIWWTVANLLPIRPLDGGNVMTELIGIDKARILSIGFGAAAAIWAWRNPGITSYAAFFAAFLAFINFTEFRRAKQGQRAPSHFDVGHPDPAGGVVGPRQGPPRSTRRVPSAVSEGNVTAMPGALDAETAEKLAWSALRRGDGAGARRVLDRATGRVSPFVSATAAAASGGGLDPLVTAYLGSPGGPSNLVPATLLADRGDALQLAQRLVACGDDGRTAAASLQTHLHYAERFEHAAAAGQIVYTAGGASKAQVAFDTACSWARAGDPNRGLEWLGRAVADGFRAPAVLDGEPDLASLRSHPGWAELRSRLD